MHAEDIKAALRKKFGTLKAFEERQGLPPESVRDVLRGRSSARTASEIAQALGKPISTVFPDRFPKSRGKDKSRKRDSHRLNSVAA